MSDPTSELYNALRGEAEPLASFGATVFDVPWWRRRIQRYLMPSRYRLWWQTKVLDVLEKP